MGDISQRRQVDFVECILLMVIKFLMARMCGLVIKEIMARIAILVIKRFLARSRFMVIKRVLARIDDLVIMWFMAIFSSGIFFAPKLDFNYSTFFKLVKHKKICYSFL